MIFDLDTGRSVTNDIRHALHDVDEQLGGIGDHPVIYRDASKTFDGVCCHQGDQFAGFYSIGETVLERAVSKALGNR